MAVQVAIQEKKQRDLGVMIFLMEENKRVIMAVQTFYLFSKMVVWAS